VSRRGHFITPGWPPGHANLFHLAVPGGKWHTADRQPGPGGQGGQPAFADPVPAAAGPARVRGDQQPGGPRVVPAAAHLPPAADGLHREDGGVVVDAGVHPAGVAGDVVDPARDRLLDIWAGEQAVARHRHRVALGAPLPAAHRQPAQLLPLLGVHADHRLAGRPVVPALPVDVPELRAPVRVPTSLQRLGVALQAEAIAAQQAAHRGRRHPMPPPGQLAGQLPQRPGRPPQRRFRVAALVRLHQRQQRSHQAGIQARGALAAPAAAPHPPLSERLPPPPEPEDARADGGLADPGHPGHGPHPAMPQQPRPGRQQQPPLPLVQVRHQHLEPHRQPIADPGRDAHTTTSNHQHQDNTLFLYGFRAPGNAARPRRAARRRSR
jgi:hypothetical protein